MGSRLDEAAVGLGFLTEEQALRALGEEVGLDFVDLAEAEIDLSLLEGFSAAVHLSGRAFPDPAEQRHAWSWPRAIRSISIRSTN